MDGMSNAASDARGDMVALALAMGLDNVPTVIPDVAGTYAIFVTDGATGEPHALVMAAVGRNAVCGHDECPRMVEMHAAHDDDGTFTRADAEELALAMGEAAARGDDVAAVTILSAGRLFADIRRMRGE